MSGIAIVHPLSLVGKELRERLEARPDLASEIHLFTSDEDEVGTVTEVAGGAGFVNRLSDDALEEVALTFFCGDAAKDRPAFARLSAEGRAIVLSSGAGLDDGFPAVAGLNERSWSGRRRLLNPAPAAMLLARVIDALRPAGLRRGVAMVVLPVSDFGQRGLDTLYEETRALLTFSGAAKPKLFPAQIAFNLLPSLTSGEEIERQVAVMLGEEGPRLSAQAVQAGVFHAVSASIALEFDGDQPEAEVRQRLAQLSEFSLVKNPKRLGPVDAAGEEKILIGDIRDAGGGRVWIWAAMDNLTTGGAINAVRVAEAVLGITPPF